MSALLGYDPERLEALRTVLADTAHQLAMLTEPDPAAGSAMAAIDATRASLLDWARQATAILMDDSLVRPTVGFDAGDVIDLVLARLQGVGWVVRADASLTPLTVSATLPAAVVTTPEAVALAEALSSPRLAELLLDADERAWLIRQLRAIGGDPTLAAAFTAALADDLGATATALATIGRGVTGSALGAAAADVLTQWLADPAAEPTTVLPADVLLPIVATDRAAAQEFLARALANADLLLATTFDAATVRTLLLTATDRGTTDAAWAGEAIKGLIEIGGASASWRPPYNQPHVDLRPLLGAVVGPWLDHFGSDAAAWSWRPHDGDLALRSVVKDATAAADVLTALAHDLRSVVLPTDPAQARVALGTLGWELAQVRTQLRAANVELHGEDHAIVDAIELVATATTSLLPIGVAASAAVSLGAAWVADHVSGWEFVPPELDDVVHDSWEQLDAALALGAVTVVAAVTTSLVQAGVVPAGALDQLDEALQMSAGSTCPSEDTSIVLTDFAAQIDAQRDDDGVPLGDVVGMLLPGTAAEVACNTHA